jgi:hypothetical protein
LRSRGNFHDFAELVIVEFLAGDLLQPGNGLQELPLDVPDILIAHLVLMVEGQVEHDHGDIQFLCDVLIPLEHGVADVVAAEDQVRLGDISRRAVQQLHICQINPGVGTDIRRISVALGVVDKFLGAFARADGGGVVFGIHGVMSMVVNSS